MSTEMNPADITKYARENGLREVGDEAVWSVSTSQPGLGVDNLRDNDIHTYWQSDGSEPHHVNIQFHRKTEVHDICIYVPQQVDTHFIPRQISVKTGTHFNDLKHVGYAILNNPSGWTVIPMKDETKQPIKTFLVQLGIRSLHQDVQIRLIKVHSPLQSSKTSDLAFAQFSTVEFASYSTIR